MMCGCRPASTINRGGECRVQSGECRVQSGEYRVQGTEILRTKLIIKITNYNMKKKFSIKQPLRQWLALLLVMLVDVTAVYNVLLGS